MSRLLKGSIITVLLTASALAADGPRRGSVASAAPAEVCQTVVLRNGFRLQYARREAAGPATRLWVCADSGDGYFEIPSEQIEGFEQAASTTPLTPAPASAPETAASGMPPARDSITNLITSAALRHRIDPDFVSSVVKAESGYNPKAISPKGAQGLMQLMPRTAASLGVENAFDPAANVEGGTKYLRQLLDQYSGDAVKALAAYNAGPQRVEQFGGVPPYRETRSYITRIIADFNGKKLEQQAESRAANK
jgi:hypothetical protein